MERGLREAIIGLIVAVERTSNFHEGGGACKKQKPEKERLMIDFENKPDLLGTAEKHSPGKIAHYR